MKNLVLILVISFLSTSGFTQNYNSKAQNSPGFFIKAPIFKNGRWYIKAQPRNLPTSSCPYWFQLSSNSNFDDPIVLPSSFRDGHLASFYNKSDKAYFVRVVHRYTNVVVSDVLRLDLNQTKPSVSDAIPTSKGVKGNRKQTLEGNAANEVEIIPVKLNKAEETYVAPADVGKKETEEWILSKINQYALGDKGKYEKLPGHYQHWTSTSSYKFRGTNLIKAEIADFESFGGDYPDSVMSKDSICTENTIKISTVRKEKFILLMLEDDSSGKSLKIKLEKSFSDDGIYPRMKKALTHLITLNKGKVAKEAF